MEPHTIRRWPRVTQAPISTGTIDTPAIEDGKACIAGLDAPTRQLA